MCTKIDSTQLFKEIFDPSIFLKINGKLCTAKGDFARITEDADWRFEWLGDGTEIPEILMSQMRSITALEDGRLIVAFCDEDGDFRQGVAVPEGWGKTAEAVEGIDVTMDASVTNLDKIGEISCEGWTEAFFTDEFERHWLDYSKLKAKNWESGWPTLKIPENPLALIENRPELENLREFFENCPYLIRQIGEKDGHPIYKRTKIDRDKEIYQLAQKKSAKKRRNLFLERISKFEWDGQPHYRGFLRNCGLRSMNGNEADTELVDAVSQALFLAVIELQFDYSGTFKFVPVIYGKEGVGKSPLLEKIGLGKTLNGGTYAPLNQRINSKNLDISTMLMGVNICELPEATALQGLSEEEKKSYLEQVQLEFRRLYTQAKISAQRRCVFCVTTNDAGLLCGLTGDTRYFPLEKRADWSLGFGTDEDWSKIEQIPDEEIEQCWAEALFDFENGARFRPILAEAEDFAIESRAQMNRTQFDVGWQNLLDFVENSIEFSKIKPDDEGFVFCSQVRDFIESEFFGAEKKRILAQWSRFWALKYTKKSKRFDGNRNDAYFLKK